MTISKGELDPSTGVPLYRQITDILREEISSGKVDASVPMTEALLLERFGVSRAPIRQALKDLSDSGFVYRKQGKGTFPVPGRRIDRSASTKPGELFQQLQSQGLNATTKVVGLSRVIPSTHIQRQLQLEQTHEVLHFVRIIYVDSLPISHSTIYLNAPEEFSPTAEELEHGPSAFQLLERDFGIALDRYDNEAWATAATAEQAKNLDIPVGSPVLAIETTFITKGGNPTGFRLALHGSDKFKYHFSTSN